MDFFKTISNIDNFSDKIINLPQNIDPNLPIVTAKVKLLWHCNLKCSFCDIHNIKEKAIISKEKALDIINQLHGLGTKKIHFSGGEVMLHPDILEILAYSSSLGIQTNITSNGTLFNKDLVKKIIATKLHSISISLDAPTPELHDKLRKVKGSFKKTVKTIEMFQKYSSKNPKLRVNTVITAQNYHTLDLLHTLLLKLNNKIFWKLIPVDSDRKKFLLTEEMVLEIMEKSKKWSLLEDFPFPEISSKKQIKQITKGEYGLSYYDKHPCYAPWLNIFIDPSGFIYPCCMLREKIPSPGNVYKTKIRDIIKSDNYKNLKMNFVKNQVLDRCKFCDDFINENRSIDIFCNIKNKREKECLNQ